MAELIKITRETTLKGVFVVVVSFKKKNYLIHLLFYSLREKNKTYAKSMQDNE